MPSGGGKLGTPKPKPAVPETPAAYQDTSGRPGFYRQTAPGYNEDANSRIGYQPNTGTTYQTEPAAQNKGLWGGIMDNIKNGVLNIAGQSVLPAYDKSMQDAADADRAAQEAALRAAQGAGGGGSAKAVPNYKAYLDWLNSQLAQSDQSTAAAEGAAKSARQGGLDSIQGAMQRAAAALAEANGRRAQNFSAMELLRSQAGQQAQDQAGGAWSRALGDLQAQGIDGAGVRAQQSQNTAALQQLLLRDQLARQQAESTDSAYMADRNVANQQFGVAATRGLEDNYAALSAKLQQQKLAQRNSWLEQIAKLKMEAGANGVGL